jgi:anti-sigma factor RsiW
MTSHLPATLLDSYAAGESGIGADALWAVEAHLETCAACRERLGSAVARRSPETTVLLERTKAALEGELGATMPARRLPGWAKMWATPTLLTRLGMTVLVVLAALGLDLTDELLAGTFPSVVLLLAPIAPLLGVAAIWSTGLDPAHELVVASPRAGLYLVLRRTLAVLVVVIPLLAVAGALAGTAPVAWLLPCLAFTAGALALGELVGLHRAASWLALVWTGLVVAPSLVAAELPVVLEPVSLPVWAGLTVVITIVLAVRRRAYTALRSGR